MKKAWGRGRARHGVNVKAETEMEEMGQCVL